MTDVLLLVMISWLAGLATGISAARLSSWINHDRLNHGRVQRGNGSWLAPYGRVVDACGRTVGYIPRPHGRTPNPPPSDP